MRNISFLGDCNNFGVKGPDCYLNHVIFFMLQRERDRQINHQKARERKERLDRAHVARKKLINPN